MTHVIAGSCVKDESCVDACPADCILPHIGDSDFDAVEQLYIDPGSCIDCGSCVTACPVSAIFADFETPVAYSHAADLNAEFFLTRGEWT